MADFNDQQQSKKLKEIRSQEEESFVERFAEREGYPYVKLSTTNVETDALILVSQEQSQSAFITPFKLASNVLHVGVKSPHLPETKEILELLSQKYTLTTYLVSTASLEKAWSLYADVSKSRVSHGGMLDISGAQLESLINEISTNTDISTKIDLVLSGKTPKKTTQLMEIIFAGAIATESSDVHIESQEADVRIRFRQDGVLQDITVIDAESYKKILSRIKLLSEMKITQTDNAQDGRFTIDYAGKDIEVRVSVIPSAYGESFVMRLLNPDGIKVGLENLGIESKLYEILLREIKKPNGMILTTGPTGSGKTTTLYSFMNKVYNPEVKIITIEDPIEYHLAGISQTQMNREKGYTFLSGLRAALRQDPDIVMVGEIRDKETANIAVNASLTGHLVLSTLHTNSAAGVIPRLIDLGISPQILAAALAVSLAQRLVRKVCQNCVEVMKPTPTQEKIIRDILVEADRNNKPLHEYGISKDQDIMLSVGRGCGECNNTGYKGRMGIFEAIITDDHIEELLNKKPSEQEVRRVAEKQGLLNMREDGIIKILNGTTSFQEVQKVVDLDIHNITQINDTDNIQRVPSPPSVHTDPSISPESVLGGKSLEISLLIDYLKKLEHEQIINPHTDISRDIKQVQETIVNLLKQNNAEEIINQNNFAQAHKNLSGLSGELELLHNEQQQNPHIDMSQKLRRIRQEIEHPEQK